MVTVGVVKGMDRTEGNCTCGGGRGLEEGNCLCLCECTGVYSAD